MTDRRIHHGGYCYHYRLVEGARADFAPVLLIGGAFQTMNSWKQATDFFTPYTSVLLADLPGSGESQFLPERYGLDFLADSVCAILDDLQIPQVNIVSASYGSLIGYRVAERNPERVSHLALVGIMREVPWYLRELAAGHLDGLQEGQLDGFASEVVGSLLCQDRPVARGRVVKRLLQGQLRRLSEDGIRKYVANTRRLLLHPALDISSPPPVRTLVFTGEYDHFTKPEYGREIAAAFDDAVFTTIQDADHLCHLEQLETVSELFHRFFEDDSLEGISGCNAMEYFSRSNSNQYGLTALEHQPRLSHLETGAAVAETF